MSFVISIVVIILAAIYAGRTEGSQWLLNYSGKLLSTDEQKRLNKSWHRTQFLERIFIFIGGGLLLYAYGITRAFLPAAFLEGIIFWIINDGIQNLIKDKSFFHISDSSTSDFEKYAQWYVKIPALVAVIILEIVTK